MEHFQSHSKGLYKHPPRFLLYTPPLIFTQKFFREFSKLREVFKDDFKNIRSQEIHMVPPMIL
eukprot:UN01725